MAVGFRGEALVDALELAVEATQDMRVCEVQSIGRRMRVDGEADQLRVDIAWVGRVAVCLGPPEEDVLVGEAEVEGDEAVLVFECVGRVAGEGVSVAEPLHKTVSAGRACLYAIFVYVCIPSHQ